jgi:hypothetical protein
MVSRTDRKILFLIIFFLAAASSKGSDLANPAFVIPSARMAIGGSYHMGGYLLTNEKVPSIMNRFNASCTFDPFKYFDIGIDVGATQLDVASHESNTDTIGLFHGDYRFSAGAHLKVSTPFFLNNYLACIAIGQASFFSSQNTYKAEYSGIDGAGAAGLQARIPQFGFVTAGAKVYLIDGKSTGYDGVKRTFSNVNNLRGWLAIDCVPEMKGDVKGKPYFSFEMSIAPDVDFGDKVPIQEIAFSFSIGWITPRLYGEDPEEPQP